MSPSASVADRSAKRQHIEDDPGHDSINSNSSDEDVCSDGEYFDWSDQGFFEDDDEDGELLSDDEEENGQSPVAIAPPTTWTDAQGLLRVGKQPPKSHANEIWSAPQSYARALMWKKVKFNIGRLDRKFPGETKESCDELKQQVLTHISSTLTIADGNDSYQQLYCDYTGHAMFWTTGPRSPSLEAAYPVNLSNGRLQYHANPNVVMIMTFLNMTKQGRPILTLPTISSFLNATDRSQQDWALNAADNLCSIHRPFCLQYRHQTQLGIWSNWDNTRIGEMIETMRTGTLTHTQQEQLYELGVRGIFTMRHRHSAESTISNGKATEVYNNMKKIAAKYSICPHEFDELCFVNSPEGTRVFYPFWHRSRQLAEEVGWDWPHLFQFASERLSRLKYRCNRNAQKAGLGEEGMDNVLLVYWMTHWICDKIKAIKDSNEEAKTVEDIAWRLLDRWGLPIVPWEVHTFGASFCKKQDVSTEVY